MKRILVLLLALLLCLPLYACAKKPADAPSNDQPAGEQPSAGQPSGGTSEKEEADFGTVGSEVVFGTYALHDSNNTFPMQWTVLHVEGNQALLLANHAYYFTNGSLGTKWVDAEWDESALKAVLNTEFIGHFQASEKAAIIEGELGSVFCLSREEYQTYVADKSYVSEAANSQVIALEERGTKYYNGKWCYWWLRDVENGMSYYVSRFGGDIEEAEIADEEDNILVRPAIWVDLTAVG